MIHERRYALLSIFFPKTGPPHLFPVPLVHHCAAIPATAELLLYGQLCTYTYDCKASRISALNGEEARVSSSVINERVDP